MNEYLPFDPAVLVDDDGKVWLYYGFCPESDMDKPDMGVEENQEMGISPGAMVAELEPDMLTLKEVPTMMIPGQQLEKGTEFEGHGFFEASSMRKVGKKYYFVYSSHLSHELCYAVSDYPNRDFSYGGILISNGDVGYLGNQSPKNMMGNNHGGIICVNEQWYIFYHRQTHGTECSRQGCAEKITIEEDGKIQQVEMTSCGLNNGPLDGRGIYPAAIACNILCKENVQKISYGENLRDKFPYIYESQEENQKISYIANIKGDAAIGYKYFEFQNLTHISLNLRGKGKVQVIVSLDEAGTNIIGEKEVCLQDSGWERITMDVKSAVGVYPLYFVFETENSVDLMNFELGSVK